MVKKLFSARFLKLFLLCSAASLTFVAASQKASPVSLADQKARGGRAATTRAKSTQDGQYLFHLSCSYCHGIDAKGNSRGPDLTSRYAQRERRDSEMLHVILQGVPGTRMPSCNCSEEDARKILSFIRSVSVVADEPIKGDQQAGEKIFFGSGRCSTCHAVNGKGGRLGPDLSNIGALRSANYLSDSILDPEKEIALGYETVTAVTLDGKRVVGVRKNEDSFSLQLMDQGEEFQMFLKKDLKEVIHEPTSLMPRYDESSIGSQGLKNLLAYLKSLKGTAATHKQ